jgi:hypothetical protein
VRADVLMAVTTGGLGRDMNAIPSSECITVGVSTIQGYMWLTAHSKFSSADYHSHGRLIIRGYRLYPVGAPSSKVGSMNLPRSAEGKEDKQTTTDLTR